MHELVALRSVIAKVSREAERLGKKRVSLLRLGVSRMLGSDAEHIKETFQIASAGTVAEAAELVVGELPFEIRCDACGGEFKSESPLMECPRCRSTEVNVLPQEELALLEVRYR